MAFTKISVETLVSASTEKVWNCFTQPEHIVKWNFASDDWHCPKASNDLRAGGKFSSTMASKDGKMRFDFEGVYSEVKPQKHLAYGMADGRTVQVDFITEGNQTRVVETFDAETENPLDMQRAGWQAILDNFKKHVEQG
ncbi:MAG: SRPBCC family protein [Bacteroidia bacterium]|nr:SRPBCC family protein [Bacteroidia bacterium]